MTREFVSFPVSDFQQIKIQMLNWVNQFNIFCFLDNHQYQNNYAFSNAECLLAAGSLRQIQASAGHSLPMLNTFLKQHSDWVFGHFGYELKNEVEHLSSLKEDNIQFPDLFFYVPEVVIRLSVHEFSIGTINKDPRYYYQQIITSPVFIREHKVSANVKNRFTQEEYLQVIHRLQRHIRAGDCYEINFCQEFYDSDIIIDPLSVFWSLGETSPNPFAAFYRVDDKFLLCASPERYLRKIGNNIYAQPIKGTWKRDLIDDQEDAANKGRLKNNAKERSENVMIVDLVRNDLSKICREGTVEVEELFGVYSFPQVHQLISTVKGILRDEVDEMDIIRATFPMGSMTGAPKLRVMELIEKYERTRRGIFSGAVGYFSPERDFDFNVVIRSLMYNAESKYLSFQTGSGITFYSNAEEEYNECLLKAQAIKKVLTG